MDAPLVYIAGPLFDEGERWFVERLDSFVAEAGARTFLPHRDNVSKTAENTGTIYRNNVAAIDRCDLVVANLNGVTTDDGTAWEIGYAVASGTPVVGVHTDWRRRFDHEVVNLMIEESVDLVARSVEEAADAVRRFVATGSAARPD